MKSDYFKLHLIKLIIELHGLFLVLSDLFLQVVNFGVPSFTVLLSAPTFEFKG